MSSPETIPTNELSLEDAVVDYVQRFRDQRINFEERQPHLRLAAEFCQVKVPSVMRWNRAGQLPSGEGRIWLLCFLELVGYRVEEFTSLAAPARQLNRLIVFGVLKSFDEVRQALSYRKIQSLYRVTLHGGSLTADRIQRMNALLREYTPALPPKQEEWGTKVARVLKIEPTIVSMSPEDLPPDNVPLADRHQTPAIATTKEAVDHTTPAIPKENTVLNTPTSGPTASTPAPAHRKLLPDELTLVHSAQLVDALLAAMQQVSALASAILDSEEADALARAVRKAAKNGELAEFIRFLEELSTNMQMLE